MKNDRKRKLSIIIVNYNTVDLLEKCLEILHKGTNPKEYKIIVVDNCSSDGSAEMTESSFPSVSVIEMEENAGFARAANEGIRQFPADYYMILNSDTEVEISQLQDMVQYLDSNPEIGALTPYQVNALGEPQLAWGKFPTIRNEIRRKRLQDALDKKDAKAVRRLKKINEIRNIDWAAGATLLLRDEALKKSGLMDENIFIFFEDIDLCTRIRKSGYRIVLYTPSVVIHHRGESVKKEFFNSSLHYRKSQLYFWKKHHSQFSFFMLRIYLVLKFFLRKVTLLFKKISNKMGDSEYQEQTRLADAVVKYVLKNKD